jgi:hypothetical protein
MLVETEGSETQTLGDKLEQEAIGTGGWCIGESDSEIVENIIHSP